MKKRTIFNERFVQDIQKTAYIEKPFLFLWTARFFVLFYEKIAFIAVGLSIVYFFFLIRF